MEHGGETFRPGQGNNAYVFPGIGLGAVASKARLIPDGFFLTAARTLAGLVEDADIRHGSLYPPLTELREVSLAIAVSVAERAYDSGLAKNERPPDPAAAIARAMYDPRA